MEEEKKRYNMVNVMRIVCAILVIAINTKAFAQFGNTVESIGCDIIARIAVPFFFVTSGYFLYCKYKVKGYFNRYIKKLVILYIVVTLISCINPMFIYEIIDKYNATGGNSGAAILLLLKFIFVNGTTGSFWFFPALIYSSIVVYFFIKKDWIKPLISISVLLYLIALMGDSYQGLVINTPLRYLVDLYNSIFDLSTNGIAQGVIFITLGALINKFRIAEKVKKTGKLFLAFSIVYVLEAYLLISNSIPRATNVYISLIILVPIIFIWALNFKFKINERSSLLMKEMSLWIYAVHGVVQFLLLKYIGDITVATVYFWVMVSAISISIAYLISIRRVKVPVGNKKSEMKILIYSSITGIFILVFFIAFDVSTFSDPNDYQRLYSGVGEKPATDSKGILWKVSNGKNDINIYGGIGYGNKEMYPLSPAVEKAIDESQICAVQKVIKDKDRVGIDDCVTYTPRDYLQYHVNEEAILLLSKEVESLKLAKDYYQLQEYKAAYFYELISTHYQSLDGKLTDQYGTDSYIQYKSQEQGKEIVALTTPLIGLKEWYNNTQEENEAYIFIGKFMSEIDQDLAMSNLELWKQGKVDGIRNYLNINEPLNDKEKEEYNNYLNIINKNNDTKDSLLIKEDVKAIQELFKDDKKYFITVDYKLLLGKNSIIKQLESLGYKIEKVTQ